MEYLLEKVDIKQKLSGKKNGKNWSFTPIGIKINGSWHNGIINDDADLEQFKDGAKVDIILFEKEGTGKYAGKMFPSFKLPKKDDILNERLDKAANLLKDLSIKFNDLDKRMDVIKTNYDDMNKRLNIIYDNPEIKKLITNLTN